MSFDKCIHEYNHNSDQNTEHSHHRRRFPSVKKSSSPQVHCGGHKDRDAAATLPQTQQQGDNKPWWTQHGSASCIRKSHRMTMNRRDQMTGWQRVWEHVTLWLRSQLQTTAKKLYSRGCTLWGGARWKALNSTESRKMDEKWPGVRVPQDRVRRFLSRLLMSPCSVSNCSALCQDSCQTAQALPHGPGRDMQVCKDTVAELFPSTLTPLPINTPQTHHCFDFSIV